MNLKIKLAACGCLFLVACDTDKGSADRADAATDASVAPNADASLGDASLRFDAAPGADATVRDAFAALDAGRDAAGGMSGYPDSGRCVQGSTRCHGKMGYQECQDDGGWSESHSCAGYSVNGTASYCAVVIPTGGEPWAACVEPACWYWIERGLLNGETEVGVCADETSLRSCRPDGTLGPTRECAGVCETAGSLNGTPLGFCAAECSDGAEECLGGPLYRRCEGGRWSTEPQSCANAALCLPSTSGKLPGVICGGPCEPGTSHCAAASNTVETCIDGDWQAAPPCLRGRCTQNGPQAQCEAECAPEQRSCAFDGAATVRVCGATNLWESESVCTDDSQCRIAGTQALGCVACVGPSWVGGNGYAVADSRCQGNAIAACGMDDTWGESSPCAEGTSCVEIRQGPSSIAYCEPE